MRTIKKSTRILSVILSVLMLFSVVSVTAFAVDNSFAYYFADQEKTSVYVTGFKGTIPADGIVTIPGEIDGYTVVGIAEHTFDNLSALKGIVIPATVTDIDENAFYGCSNIITITTENKGETDVAEDVFDSTKWYEEHKQDYVISGTTLISYKGSDEIVTVPYNCTMIADGAFKNKTKIKTVYLPKEITTIGKEAFYGCSSLETINAESGMGSLTIGVDAFAGTPWFNDFPGTFVILGTTLIKYKGADSYVTIPNVVTAIADKAFFVGDSDSTIAYKVKVPVSVKQFNGDCFCLYKSVSMVYPSVVVYQGSTAEDYCEKFDIKYTYAPAYGDADLDNEVTAADARYILRVSAKLESPELSTEVMEAADVTCDNKITSADARLILRISAGLEEVSVNNMPRSDYETLITAAHAVSLAKAYGCAYSKNAYQSISKYSMNANSQTYLTQFKSELTSEKKAQTVTYSQDSKEAIDNLFDITLIDASKIDSYSCVYDDGYYTIKIVLKDETINGNDVDAVSATEKMFPVATVSHFTNKIANQYWYKASSTDMDYDMTYTGCTLEMKVDCDTLMINYMTLTMNYDFAITGKIMGINVGNSSRKSPATATRTDTIKYTNFVYFAS